MAATSTPKSTRPARSTRRPKVTKPTTSQPRRTRKAKSPIAFTASFGIQGWGAVDSILLAALALEAPVLLVGAHGTAKTLVAERVANALNQRFRHYNASLLNYDDLVGIRSSSFSTKSIGAEPIYRTNSSRLSTNAA